MNFRHTKATRPGTTAGALATSLRPATTVPTIRTTAVLACLAVSALFAVAAEAGPICPSGTFRVHESPFIGTGSNLEDDLIVIRDFEVRVAGCESVAARARNIESGVKVRARWDSCEGLGGPVKLRMKIDSSCQTMSGKLIVIGGSRKRFTAESVVPAPSVELDPAVTPDAIDLPRFDDGMPRPVAALTDDSGIPASFVENELIVVSDEEEEVQRFAERWGGEVVQSFLPAQYGLPGESQHLVRIDTSLADQSKLAADLKALNPESSGELRVSSGAALGLLSAASSEAAGGLPVGLNIVMHPTSYRDRSTNEAAPCHPSNPGCTPPDLAGQAYNPNPFTWSYFQRGGTQNIGVGDAWRALDFAGRLSNKVKIAVIDGGFLDVDDNPADWKHHTNSIHAMDPNEKNQNPCTNGMVCDWHGTNVVGAAMGVADNNAGAAGPAGPVAKAVTIRMSGDIFNYLGAYAIAFTSGAKIVNMSFGARVPATLAWTVTPLDVATAAARSAGILMVAAAGNDNQDVDEKHCVPVFKWPCWEAAWFVPAENSGVMAVGALADNMTTRRSSSNYGGQVDIFGPGNLWVGPDFANPWVHTFNATSAASPFVAGVAALVWAANPGLSADDVERILIETANPSSDGSVRRYVNAFDAVIRAIGSTPPEISIRVDSRPSQDFCGQPTRYFVADASDREDGVPPIITWRSSIDGPIGTGTEISSTLTRGTHTITATATDSAGISVTSNALTITVDYNTSKAEIRIVSPKLWDQFPSQQAIAFDVDGTDFGNCGGGNKLRDDRIEWYSKIDGFLGRGRSLTRTLTTIGWHGIDVYYIYGDREGEWVYANIAIEIQVAPVLVDLPPIVTITQPTSRDLRFNHFFENNEKCLYVEGSAWDPEDGVMGPGWCNLRWETNRSDIPGQTVMWCQPAFTFCLKRQPDRNGETVHELRFYASDRAGNETASLPIRVTLEDNYVK